MAPSYASICRVLSEVHFHHVDLLLLLHPSFNYLISVIPSSWGSRSAPGSGLLNVVQLREQAERNAAALMSRGAGKRSKWDSAK
eukprot:scaffold65785_cov20-Tisochrysis_lutea.AAC.1